MQESAQKQIQAFAGKAQMASFAARLLEWLNRDLNPNGEPLAESRARALLLAANVLDEPTRNSFAQVVDSEQGMRLALYDLLSETGLSDNEEIAVLAAASTAVTETSKTGPSWLALAVAAYAWRSDFLIDRLDPAAPPDPYSPAGQVLKRAAFFVRKEVQRSATDRDKLGRKLAASTHAEGPPTLDTMQPDAPIAPLPPYFRPPIPETYPEYNTGIEVSTDELGHPSPPPTREGPISITDADLSPAEPPAPASPPDPPTPQTQPPLRIDASQLEPPARPATTPPARQPHVVMPSAAVTTNIERRGRSRRARNELKSTKLHIVVQESPDGPGLYGLQVRVSSRGIRRYVAGTTNKDGEFICELPVTTNTGLTYDVDVTWPREYGSEVERKSITLNADRTHFTLPFYRSLKG